MPSSLFNLVVRNARIQSDVVALRVLSFRPISTLYDQPPKQEQRGNALGTNPTTIFSVRASCQIDGKAGAHHEENAPQKWAVAGRDDAEPGVVEREQDDGRAQHRERDALHARAVLFGGTLDPVFHSALHDV